MTTQDRINLYTDALWLKAGQDYPGLVNPEPDTFGLSEWTATNLKKRVVQDFERKV